MTKRVIEINEQDIRQALILQKLFAEARFDIKGDAIMLAAQSLSWLQDLSQRFKATPHDEESKDSK